MSNRNEKVSELTTGSEVMSKISQDSYVGQCVGSNRGVYKFTGVSSVFPVVISNAIPLKPPCVYGGLVRWTAINTTGGILVQYSAIQVNQPVSGGGIGQAASTLINSASIAGNALAFSKNPSRDTLDITLAIAIGGTVTYTLEVDIFSATQF
jgi:hypothetical protein